MRLVDLKKQESAVIVSIDLSLADQQRLAMLGLQVNETIRYIDSTLWHDPLIFQINESLLAIRRADALFIQVEKVIQ